MQKVNKAPALSIVLSLFLTSGMPVFSAEKENTVEFKKWTAQGQTFFAARKYAEAENAWIKAFQLAKNDSSNIESIKNLGSLYYAQGKCNEDDDRFRTFMYGLNLQIATCLSKNDFKSAEELCKLLLKIREKALGPDAPRVADSLNHLAKIYVAQNKQSELEPIYKRCLVIWEKTPGDKHDLLVMNGLKNLAGFYAWQGKYAEAEPLFRRCLELSRSLARQNELYSVLVPQFSTILAEIYCQKGQLKEADPILRDIITTTEAAVKDVPLVSKTKLSSTFCKVGTLYADGGNTDEAEKIFKRALVSSNTYEEDLNKEWAKKSAEEKKDSAETHQSLIDNNRKIKAVVLEKYALCLRAMGKIEEAKKLEGEAEPIVKTYLEKADAEPDPLQKAALSTVLGEIYLTHEQFKEAEPLLKTSLAQYEKMFGPNNFDVAKTADNLAQAYAGQANFASAEPLYLKSLQIREKLLGQNNPKLADSLEKYATVLKKANKDEEAASIEERLKKLKEQ